MGAIRNKVKEQDICDMYCVLFSLISMAGSESTAKLKCANDLGLLAFLKNLELGVFKKKKVKYIFLLHQKKCLKGVN